MKTVLITGANRGIGFATSKILSTKKYKVIGVARSKVKNFPGIFYECDLSKENEYIIEEKNGKGPSSIYIKGPYAMAEGVNKNKRSYCPK